MKKRPIHAGSPLRVLCLSACLFMAAVAVRAGGEAQPAGEAAKPAPKALHLPSEVLKLFEGKYELERTPDSPPPPPGLPPIDITADQDGLTVTFSESVRFLPLSELEFFNPQTPDYHLTFSKDANGRVAGFHLTNIPKPAGMDIVGPSELKARKLP